VPRRRAAVLLVLASLAGEARALESPAPVPLHYDLALDLSVTGGALLASLLLAGFENELVPASCRWCVPGSVDYRLRNASLWGNPQAADALSGVLANAAIPVAMLGYLLLSANASGDITAGLVDVLLVAEAVALAEVLTEGVKEVAGRQRPWAYFGPDPGHGGPPANVSFFSGHTTFAFSTAAATFTVASLRAYPGAWIAGTAGLAAAAFVGYLRMAADAHYFTDVLAGAAVGGLVGFAVPYLFHGRKDPSEPGAISPAPGGIAVTLW